MSCHVDLEDDSLVRDRFMQFTCLGTYKDATVWTGVREEDMWLRSPDEVEAKLNTPVGVDLSQVACPFEGEDEDEDEDPAESTDSIMLDWDTLPEEDDTHDGDSTPDKTDNDDLADPSWRWHRRLRCEEPLEEFEESSDSDDGEDEAAAILDARLVQLMSDLGEEEGRKHFQREVHSDMELLLPLRLYVMVHEHDIPALKLLARNRFYRAAEVLWRHADCFPDVVDELYTSTPPSDVAMREIVCRLVASGIERDSHQRSRMRGVMRKHADFALGVLEYMVASGYEWA